MKVYEVTTTSGLYGPVKHALVVAKSYADAEKAVFACKEAFSCPFKHRIESISERSEMVIINLPENSDKAIKPTEAVTG